MRRGLVAGLVGAAASTVVLSGAPASAMTCLDGQGVTVVVDDQRSREPSAQCVPQGNNRPAAEVLRDAGVSPDRTTPWTFWSSDGRGTWERRPTIEGVSVVQGGFLAWSRTSAEPRIEPRPPTEVERLEATRPPQERRLGEEHALADVLRLVGVVVAILLALVGAVWVVQRRQDR